MGLTNKYVEDVCNLVLRHNFIGTYPIDLFPFKTDIKKPYSMVINLSTSEEPGSHFIAMYISNNKIEYFDSYGLPPISYRILEFINNNNYIHNNLTIQNMNSTHCGYYCYY